ncbi:uncharacterized protein JCM15063_006195 [Sporobolomyces koalae]|uniref:uncharacterized protein n=1 Tax=Sporobolomyces koalae TaxID=500713 RepID=UPI003178A1FA
MLRSAAPQVPTTPTKRPLTAVFTACKRDADDVITKKRKLASVPTTSTSLPTPASTPTKHVNPADPLTPSRPVTAKSIPHVFAHAHLVLSTSSPLTATLPLSGRSEQKDTLEAFLCRRFPQVYRDASAAANPRGPGPAALYASGPPGIGKTALLSAVLDNFENQVAQKNLGGTVRISMRNCSTVVTGETAWERLAAGLGIDWNDRTLKGKEMFEQGLKDGKQYLLILDEIDHLCTGANKTSSAAPDLLNALFALASVPSSPLTLIGIANDLTLKALNLTSVASPSRLFGLKGRHKSDPLTTPTKPINLHFAPYTWQELVKIVAQRLELLAPSYPEHLDRALVPATSAAPTTPARSFPLIDKVALERAAKKVATGTGDVRTILDLVRKSISLVSSTLDPASLATLTPASAPKASMKHMTAALSSSAGLTTAPSLSTRLASLNPNQRFVLVSTVISLSRQLPLGLDTTDGSVSASATISLEDTLKVYREVVGREESLKSVMHSTKDGFAQAIEMVQDLSGFIEITSSNVKNSPSKTRKTPSPSKRGGKLGGSSVLISSSESAPINELVKIFLPSSTVEEKEDETARLCRKMLTRELSDQQWKRKLIAMGRDEERQAEEELQGREWERSMKAQAAERGEMTMCD